MDGPGVRSQAWDVSRARQGGLVYWNGVGDASGSMQAWNEDVAAKQFGQAGSLQVVRCGKVRRVVAICGSGAASFGRGVLLVEGEMGWRAVGGGLVCCNAGQGRTRQAMQGRQKSRETRQGTAVRRIEGFEKRQSAKPKRCLSHPPWLRSCVSGSTYAPGGMSCCTA